MFGRVQRRSGRPWHPRSRPVRRRELDQISGRPYGISGRENAGSPRSEGPSHEPPSPRSRPSPPRPRAQKVQAAEDAWNTRDPEKVALAYTEDSVWRNRDEFVTGRDEIVAFLTRKWERELDYALRKELWAFDGNRIAVRFQYECHDADGQWWRSYGNELWEFDDDGLMRRREASINDVAIDECERRIFGPRPESEYGVPFPIQ